MLLSTQHVQTNNDERRRASRNDLSSNTGAVQPKSGMADKLKSNLGNYWSAPFAVNCHTIDHTDGTSFAMMVAEQAGVNKDDAGVF